MSKYVYDLFFTGNLFQGYKNFGAHFVKENGKNGVRFTVYAKNAKNVQVVGDFNEWDGSIGWLTKIDERGIFSEFFEGVKNYDIYKLKIEDKYGNWKEKIDPYGFFSEVRPGRGNKVYNIENFPWTDEEWMNNREHKNFLQSAITIYEVHFGSWRVKGFEDYYSYDEMKDMLIPYVKEMGFTHIELLPLLEHPLDASWGYQATGYFNATSRYGEPKQLMSFIDKCHNEGIGVIMDWVPVHFCKDDFALIDFDGTPMYEYDHDDIRENELWGTRNFAFDKGEIHSFLLSSAHFFAEYFHMDGFRVDAMSNIVHYLGDSTRGVNEDGVALLKKFNVSLHECYPGILTFAEDSSIYPGVTHLVCDNGLGFDYKWNMGFMNDVLDFMESDYGKRSVKQNNISFAMMYNYSENYVLPFSHDEVVHGKKSLVDKMPGDYWQKFANLRLLLGYQFAHPGKNLLFMGADFGQFREWTEADQLDWKITIYESHYKTIEYMRDLNHVYLENSELFELDHDPNGFEWVDIDSARNGVYIFKRKNKAGSELISICNFSPSTYEKFEVGVDSENTYTEIFNSDHEKYFGSNVVNENEINNYDYHNHGKNRSIVLRIPPLGVIYLKENGKTKVNNI